MEDGRRAIRGIRPAALEDLCAPALRGGPKVDACIDPAVDGLPGAIQTTVYRIVQESLGNSCRHSGAESVGVTVRLEAEAVKITVVDTGRGFDPKARDRAGFGLIGMTERVQLGGGEFSVASTPGLGTQVTAWLPIREP